MRVLRTCASRLLKYSNDSARFSATTDRESMEAATSFTGTALSTNFFAMPSAQSATASSIDSASISSSSSSSTSISFSFFSSWYAPLIAASNSASSAWYQKGCRSSRNAHRCRNSASSSAYSRFSFWCSWFTCCNSCSAIVYAALSAAPCSCPPRSRW